MVGEEYGWVALDGVSIILLTLATLIVVMVPGFLLSLALFPKRMAMSMGERMALSFGLGLAPALVLMLLNMLLEVKVNLITSLLVLVFICIASVLGFLYRGGIINLLEWYTSKEAADSE